MTPHFTPLEGSVLLCQKGVYTETSLVLNRGHVYAKHGRGVVRLLYNGVTSASGVIWSDIQPSTAFIEKQGYVVPLIQQLTAA